MVAVALANARKFGFETVGCSSTGNLANSVAAQAARLGIRACILVPADLEPAKILNTLVYGARLVRIDGNYDHVNRLCTLIADEYSWGFVNVNLRPYYAEGSKTVGYEIAEQLGWRLPDNVVVPMAGGSLIRKIRKAFKELAYLGLVEDKPVRFFGAQASGCSPISTAVKDGTEDIIPQKPNTIARSLAIGNPADGPAAAKMIREDGGWAEDVSDVEIVSGIQELAETEGIFTETAGGVTTAVTARLYAHGRISPDETTVTVITGNGLKTTDALAGRYDHVDGRAIRPRLADFDAYLRELDGAREPELVTAGDRIRLLKSYFLPLLRVTPTARNSLSPPPRTCPACWRRLTPLFPRSRPRSRMRDGKLRKFINIYINDEDIRFLGGDSYAFQDGDECDADSVDRWRPLLWRLPLATFFARRCSFRRSFDARCWPRFLFGPAIKQPLESVIEQHDD